MSIVLRPEAWRDIHEMKTISDAPTGMFASMLDALLAEHALDDKERAFVRHCQKQRLAGHLTRQQNRIIGICMLGMKYQVNVDIRFVAYATGLLRVVSLRKRTRALRAIYYGQN